MTLARDLIICAACGTDEAVRDAANLAPIEPSAWPVAERSDWTSHTL
ncbi:hypothetical protein ACWEKT_39895 [Nocardia takedensis]